PPLRNSRSISSASSTSSSKFRMLSSFFIGKKLECTAWTAFNLWHQSTAINGEMFNVINTLFTRLCYSHAVHTLFTKRFSQPQASIKLDRKSCGDSSRVLKVSSEQTIGRADNLQSSWQRRSHQVAVAYSENGFRELARLFRKRRMSLSRMV